MAGMLYLPRLFVYHCDESEGTATYNKFCLMEKRLQKFIMNPAMISTWFFGLLMIFKNPLIASNPWFSIKILLVFFMSGLHGYFSFCRKSFAFNKNNKSSRHYRVVNEGPTVLLLIIVFLAVFQPTF